MSFQAYLDNAEKKCGRTPQEIVDLAAAQGFGPETKAGPILAWLAEELDISRGHGMALVHVIKNGPEITDKHVGSGGTHADASTTLRLDGVAHR